MFTCLAGHTNCSSTAFGRCEKPTRMGRSTTITNEALEAAGHIVTVTTWTHSCGRYGVWITREERARFTGCPHC